MPIYFGKEKMHGKGNHGVSTWNVYRYYVHPSGVIDSMLLINSFTGSLTEVKEILLSSRYAELENGDRIAVVADDGEVFNFGVKASLVLV